MKIPVLVQTSLLTQISKLYPTIDHALARISVLAARLTLPKPAIHVISDVHGEYAKLRHVVNNGSGSLPLLVEELFGGTWKQQEKLHLLSFIYYPREAYASLKKQSSPIQMRKIFTALFEIIAHLTERSSFEHLLNLIPEMYTHLFREFIIGPRFGRSQEYLDALLSEMVSHENELEFLRLTSRLVRNMLISEIIVAGDFGDRGPRIDRCIEFISRQPNVSVTWGNHDLVWMGACLGDRTLIATVLRFSLRYGRLDQLEEGYGISLNPLENLALKLYGNDPAKNFTSKSAVERDALLVSRMQKAISIIQFKLESQIIRRNPGFGMDRRDLLKGLSPQLDAVLLDGKAYPLQDTSLPTVDPAHPEKLTLDEEQCMEALQNSFLSSPVLWRHMQYLTRVGGMYLVRDQALIFHGCVPVLENGEFAPVMIDGEAYKGRELFDVCNTKVQLAFRTDSHENLDFFWYLACGPLSPLFGKDKMATFESYFLEDKKTHVETKNPYFRLIHEKDFCRKVLREFGVESDQGLIVNGHVPVKIEKGESPIKKSGMAVTIDGAFSEAYGDRGYTLVLDSNRSYLAQHSHFDSVATSIQTGADMIPDIVPIFSHTPPRIVRDTEQGREIQDEIALLKELVKSYRKNELRESVQY